MKSFVVLLAALAVAQFTEPAAAAEPFPAKPVRIIVGYSPGTTSGVFARIIAQKLAARWGQSVIVENRDGAAGSIGAEAVAKSEPDGYTLMLGSNAFTLGRVLRVKLPYDPFTDLYAESCMGHIELARLGAKAKVKTLVISHVTEQIDQPGVRERVVREMAEIYSGNIIFGEDMLEIPVKGPAAAKLL